MRCFRRQMSTAYLSRTGRRTITLKWAAIEAAKVWLLGRLSRKHERVEHRFRGHGCLAERETESAARLY
jgi:hypothetical protein